MITAINKWSSKWLTRFCGIGLMLEIYKHQKHTKCPRHNADNESTEHVLISKEITAQTQWKDSLKTLHTWMIKNKGCPDLADAVVDNLDSWHKEEVSSTMAQYSSLLQEAIWQQQRIGWKSFIEGLWSKKWEEDQHQYLIKIKSRRTSILWISKAQCKVWQIAWDLWTHQNKMLHTDRKTIHQYEMNLLDQEISIEWQRQNILPCEYSHLFQGNLDGNLKRNIYHNKQWITSVWLAQGIHSLQRQDRNVHILNIYCTLSQWNNGQLCDHFEKRRIE